MKSSSPAVEKAARAMYEALDADPRFAAAGRQWEFFPGKEQYLHQARAAVIAYLEERQREHSTVERVAELEALKRGQTG